MDPGEYGEANLIGRITRITPRFSTWAPIPTPETTTQHGDHNICCTHCLSNVAHHTHRSCTVIIHCRLSQSSSHQPGPLRLLQQCLTIIIVNKHKLVLLACPVLPQHCTVTRRFLGPTSAVLSQHPPLLSNASLPSISTRTNTCTPRCTSHLPRLPRHLGYTLPLATLHTSAEPIYSLLSVIPLISDRSAETTQRHCRHHRRTHSQESQPLSLPAMQKPNHSTYLYLSQSCQLW